MKGFVEFIRKQRVIGLAVGFILGGAISKLVAAIITDFINPIVGLVLGMTKGLETASLKLGTAKIMWGHMVSVIIDFLIIALIVYYGIKGFKLDKLEQK